MTTSIPAASFTERAPSFTEPAPAERLERVAAALTAKNFAAEILDDAAAARTRIKDLIPEGASVFTGASETSAYPASRRTSARAGGTTTSGHAVRPWTAPPSWARSGG